MAPTDLSAPTTAFLARVEGLSHPARMCELAHIGLKSKQGDAESQTVLKELGRAVGGHQDVKAGPHNYFHRYLAVKGAERSGDVDVIMRGLSDPSAIVRSVAVRSAVMALDDEKTQKAMEMLLERRQTVALLDFVKQLVPAKRRHVVNSLWPLLKSSDQTEDEDEAEWKKVNFRRIVPYMTADIVKPLLDDLFVQCTTHEWSIVARHHQELVLEHITRLDAKSVTKHNDSVVEAYREIVSWQPKRALEAFEHFVAIGLATTGSSSTEKIFNLYPSSCIKLILRAKDHCEGMVASFMRRKPSNRKPLISGDEAIALKPYTSRWISSDDVLKQVVPKDRLKVLEAFRDLWASDDGIVAYALRILPREARIAEARRNIECIEKNSKPNEQAVIENAALLPYDECRKVLDKYLKDPDMDTRGEAIGSLIRSVTYDHQRLSDALKYCLTKKNEQTNFHFYIATGLDELPRSIWAEVHLPLLSQVLQQAVDQLQFARLSSIIDRLAPRFPLWAAQEAAKLYKAGQIPVFSFQGERTTPKESARAFVNALQKATNRFKLAPFLCKYAHKNVIPEEHWEKMKELLLKKPGDPIQLSSLFKIDKSKALSLIPELVAKDKEMKFMKDELVVKFLDRHRQDLISEDLLSTPPSEYWSYVDSCLSFTRFPTWSPKTQAFFGKLLEKAVPFTSKKEEEQRKEEEKKKEEEKEEIQLEEAESDDGENNSAKKVDSDDDKEEDDKGDADDDDGETSAEKKRTWDDLGAFTKLRCIDILASLPVHSPDHLILLASEDESELMVMNRALASLTRVDDTTLTATALFDALGDSRARTAVLYCRRILRMLPPREVLGMLKAMPLASVGVAKEIIRLLSEMPSAAAFQLMLDFPQWENPSTTMYKKEGLTASNDSEKPDRKEIERRVRSHRDVCLALIKALCRPHFVTRPETWDVFQKAYETRDDDPIIVSEIFSISPDDLKEHIDLTKKYGRMLRNGILNSDCARTVSTAICRLMEFKDLRNIEDADGKLLDKLLDLFDDIENSYDRGAVMHVIARLAEFSEGGKGLSKLHELIDSQMEPQPVIWRLNLITRSVAQSESEKAIEMLRSCLEKDHRLLGMELDLIYGTRPLRKAVEYLVDLDAKGRLEECQETFVDHLNSLGSIIVTMRQRRDDDPDCAKADAEIKAVEEMCHKHSSRHVRRAGFQIAKDFANLDHKDNQEEVDAIRDAYCDDSNADIAAQALHEKMVEPNSPDARRKFARRNRRRRQKRGSFTVW